MHDPLTVAFEIRRPWPRRDAWTTGLAARTGVRWQHRSAYSVVAGRDLSNGNELAQVHLPEIGQFVEANDPAAALRRITAERALIAALEAIDADPDYNLMMGKPVDTDPLWVALAEGWGWEGAAG